ncbi:MAG: hypothetical protein JSW39_17990 [Desulfobacterales bacterium]|nr:MAG: hypothetical protein JSW39_17990 [Desulfobacterales bacterium]
MKRSKTTSFITALAASVTAVFIFTGVASALDISLEPAKAQREIGGKVRVHIYANAATDLISMGVKVSFDPTVLQVESASKYEDFDEGWTMDADGDPSTTGDRYYLPAVEIDNTAGTVMMIGGRLIGETTTGLTGKVLLGWIVFEAISNGDCNLQVDLAKYHTNHPTQTFDNFVSLVNLQGQKDEPTNVPGDLGLICVTAGACVGDINENSAVDMGDFSIVRSAMGKSFPQPGYRVDSDLNGNGAVDMGDFAILRGQMGTSNCPSCNL